MPHALDGQYVVKGITLDVQVSPCCWMYPHYPLQVRYSATDGHSAGFVADNLLKEKDSTKQIIQTMLEKHLTPEPCEVCKHPHLFNDTESPKSDGSRLYKCEKCFIAKLNGELDQALAKERDELAKQDKKMKREGYTHRVTAWVHPPRGGDYQIDLYAKGEPTAALIEIELRKKRSRIVDDYTIYPLK